MSVEEIQTLYDKALTTEKDIHKDLSAEEQKTRALQVLATEFKKQLRSPAVAFEGEIIAATDKRDIVAKLRKEALISYGKDPQQAIAAGLTNDDGFPLDPRPTWSTGRDNPGFGKPLPEHNWTRTLYGVALKSSDEEGKPKFFTLNTNGAVAENDSIPMFKPVKFRAIDRSAEGDSQYSLNASMYTTFDDSDTALPEPMDLITQFCSDMTLDTKQLETYHADNKTNFNRMVILKGDISMLALEPNSIGNRRMILEAEDAFEDLDAIGTTCWVPSHIDIDFAENSKVIIIGSTSQGFKYENGAATEELGDVMINVYGVYALPKYKVSVETVEITEDKVAVEEDLGNKPVPMTPEKVAETSVVEEPVAEVVAEAQADPKPASSW